MKNFIVMFMAFCGWGAFILSCTGVIGDSSEIMAFAPLLAIPQLVRFYGGWEKSEKGFAFAAACLGRLVGRRRIVVPVAVQPLVRKRNDLGASLAGRLCSLGCRFSASESDKPQHLQNCRLFGRNVFEMNARM